MSTPISFSNEYGTYTIPDGVASVGYRLTTVDSPYRPSNVDVCTPNGDALITFYRVRYGVVQRTIPDANVYDTSSGAFSLREGIPRTFSFISSVDSAYVVRNDSTAVDLTWW
jgi:hypothetical protein